MNNQDPFLTQIYDRLHETPMQRKLRTIAPIPVGTVFIEHPGMTEEEIRGHLRLMKKLGFTCLKQFMLCQGSDEKRFMHMALDEGIIPWWYDEGGWEEISPDLLKKIGLPEDMPIAELRTHPAFLDYQMQVFRCRVNGNPPPDPTVPAATAPKAQFSYDMALDEGAHGAFVEWLQRVYCQPREVFRAWNQDHAGNEESNLPWETWEEVEAGIASVDSRDYRHLRDIIRFKADLLIQSTRARAVDFRRKDRNAPFRAGGEMGIFLPFAARSTDMEGIAEEMAWAGSFYPSIHLSWHFEESNFEVARSAYMQASLVHDWFKGGWSATWESTGGPQQLSGGKGWTHEAALKTPGFTVDAGVITQLMLSYLAAGFKGFGFWCWNGRSFGWEAGEYALLDRSGQVTERARQAGRIGQSARRWRDELWAAHKHPMVGVLYDFDNEAMWAAVSIAGRDHYKYTPVQARIGVSRALIDHNIPFEYVTTSDLHKGLADRYRVIYLPAVLSISHDLLKDLHDYVRRGGRLVLDSPSAWYDEYGRILSVGQGSLFESIFGCLIRDFQYASNVPRSLEGEPLAGFVLDLQPTFAQVKALFDNGLPAVTEAKIGAGTAVILGFEASLACFPEGSPRAEERLMRFSLGPYQPPYACDGVMCYRLCAPNADHYFLINPGPQKEVDLKVADRQYVGVEDAITLEEGSLGTLFIIPGYSGRWLRFRK